MNIENYIESRYRELILNGNINSEFINLYSNIKYEKLRKIFAELHFNFISLFRTMNERLPTNEIGNHFWAEPSRSLINNIEITLGLFNALKNTEHAFDIDEYYYDLIIKCRDFLNTSMGSTLPANMPKIELYYTIPIFKSASTITVKNTNHGFIFDLKLIGRGSYADVYKYQDTFYNKTFAIKRAKKELIEKEKARFKREFEEMDGFSSPYILDVYCFNENQNEYIMEYMDYTLDEYIRINNSILTDLQRKNIVQQILKAFDYIQSKGRLHRDISPKNILVKKYDDVIVVKISDFGLVKIPDSSLTSFNTEFKGWFNDPSLVIDGFDTYNLLHETYALTRIVYYVLTGKTNTESISNSKLGAFVRKGLNNDKSMRFQNIKDIFQAFHNL